MKEANEILQARINELEEFARWVQKYPISADIREKAEAVLKQPAD